MRKPDAVPYVRYGASRALKRSFKITFITALPREPNLFSFTRRGKKKTGLRLLGCTTREYFYPLKGLPLRVSTKAIQLSRAVVRKAGFAARGLLMRRCELGGAETRVFFQTKLRPVRTTGLLKVNNNNIIMLHSHSDECWGREKKLHGAP